MYLKQLSSKEKSESLNDNTIICIRTQLKVIENTIMKLYELDPKNNEMNHLLIIVLVVSIICENAKAERIIRELLENMIMSF